MTAPMFAVGDVLLCIDATNGSHFLRVGDRYRVCEVRDADGWLLLRNVTGDFMVRMWEPQRFQLAAEALPASSTSR